jgi:signal peptidase I
MRILKKILLFISIPLIALYISVHYYQLMLIQGRSMMPTYKHLQIVLLDKHTDSYSRGQAVAFSCDGLSSVLVKRIVAGPGDRAQIREGTLYVNGTVSDIYPQEGMFDFAGLLQEETVLGAMEYLMIGDNT